MNHSHRRKLLQICMKHNEPIILFDEKQHQPVCVTCIQKQTGMAPISQIEEKYEEIKFYNEKQFQEQQQQLQQQLDSFHMLKQNLNKRIDEISQILINQIKNIKQFKEKFEEQLVQCNYINTFDQLNTQLKEQKDNHQKVQTNIQQLFSSFQQIYLNANHFNQIFRQSSEIIKNQDQTTSNVEINQVQKLKYEKKQNSQSFQYELIQQSKSKIENDYCCAFAINNDNTILIFGCSSKIKIYQFINGKIGKELQVLSVHKDWVFCLQYLKQSDCFISGSFDSQIIIWKQNKKNQWEPQQKLNGHKNNVNCLLINKNEDLLISGSKDESVKFWKQFNDQWSCEQTIKIDDQVLAISLNEMECKLICCGAGTFIYVMESQDDGKWIRIQNINVNQKGYRVAFIQGDQFVFQPKTIDYIEIYDQYNCTNQFIQQSQFKIQSCKDCRILFPCQFIKSLNILLAKHGQYLNIFSIKQNKDYELIQTIQFDHHCLYGILNEDGQYLITWDEKSKEIQVRQLKPRND